MQLRVASDPSKAPVLLIPGIWEHWKFLLPIARLIHERGHAVHVLPALGYNRGTVAQMAEIVSAYLAEAQLEQVSIVAHSKGGLIAKYLMNNSWQATRVERLIAINTPFAGSSYARHLLLRSLRALSPEDAGILELAGNILANTKIVTLRSVFDPHIPGGSEILGGTNVVLETMGHFRPLSDRRLHRALSDFLPES